MGLDARCGTAGPGLLRPIRSDRGGGRGRRTVVGDAQTGGGWRGRRRGRAAEGVAAGGRVGVALAGAVADECGGGRCRGAGERGADGIGSGRVVVPAVPVEAWVADRIRRCHTAVDRSAGDRRLAHRASLWGRGVVGAGGFRRGAGMCGGHDHRRRGAAGRLVAHAAAGSGSGLGRGADRLGDQPGTQPAVPGVGGGGGRGLRARRAHHTAPRCGPGAGYGAGEPGGIPVRLRPGGHRKLAGRAGSGTAQRPAGLGHRVVDCAAVPQHRLHLDL